MDKQFNKKIIYFATIDALKDEQLNANIHICKVACITQRQLKMRLQKPSIWSFEEIARLTEKFENEFKEYIKSNL